MQRRIMERNINVIRDVNDNQIVVINDIRFKGRQNIDWDEVERYLKQEDKKLYLYDIMNIKKETSTPLEP